MTSSSQDLIGAAIKNRRKELGYSQEWLAEFLDVSYQQVQRYENGISMINVETIQKISEALSVPVTFFSLEMTLRIPQPNHPPSMPPPKKKPSSNIFATYPQNPTSNWLFTSPAWPPGDS